MKLFVAGIAVGLSFLTFGAYVLASSSNGSYHLLKKVSFGAAEGGREYFDYITADSAGRRVYLSHGTEVVVVDADSGVEVGKITGLKQDHGIALVKDLNKGFISDGPGNRAVIFDLKSLKVIGEVRTGEEPDSILYDPASKHVFTFNGGSKDVTVIDSTKEAVLATIPLGGRPEQAVADGKGMIYDNITDTNEVVGLDSRAGTIKARWPLAPVARPFSIAMDREHRRLFIAGRNPKLLVVMDADNGKIIQSFPIGDAVDANAYDPETRLLFSATREGTLHIFHEDSPNKFIVVEAVKTEFGAKTMALDPKTHNVFLDTSDFEPPAAPSPNQPNPQPRAIPGTFHLLIYGR